MTREEAIGIVVCMAYHTRPDEEDVEQAIEVLKQEPCGNTDNKEIYVVGSDDANYMQLVKLSKEQVSVLAWLFDTFDGLDGFYCAKPEDCLTEICEEEE